MKVDKSVYFQPWFDQPWMRAKIAPNMIKIVLHAYLSNGYLNQTSNFKVYLDTQLRDKHGHLFLWDLKLLCPSFKVGQIKVEKMHFCRLSRNWVFRVDLCTHLRDKHWHLFLWDLDLFWPSFKVGQTKFENIHFW